MDGWVGGWMDVDGSMEMSCAGEARAHQAEAELFEETEHVPSNAHLKLWRSLVMWRAVLRSQDRARESREGAPSLNLWLPLRKVLYEHAGPSPQDGTGAGSGPEACCA